MERTRFIVRNQDNTFSICFTAKGNVMPTPDDPTLVVSPEELLDLAVDLDVWRWRLTGDSFDPRVQRQIREEYIQK